MGDFSPSETMSETSFESDSESEFKSRPERKSAPVLRSNYMSGSSTSDTNLALLHLEFLIVHLETTYRSTEEELWPLLRDGEITYPLLWALFRPNEMLITDCPGTRRLRGVQYDAGEFGMERGMPRFQLQARHLDFDGERLGEVSTRYNIAKFAGRKRIRDLSIFPLRYHPSPDDVQRQLIHVGRRFTQLQGIHCRYYRGAAFTYHQGELMRFDVDGRIMVDAQLFREMNPNHWTPKVDSTLLDHGVVDLNSHRHEGTGMVMAADRDVSCLTERELMCCSATVRGFSFDLKSWCESVPDHAACDRVSLTYGLISGVRGGWYHRRRVADVELRRPCPCA